MSRNPILTEKAFEQSAGGTTMPPEDAAASMTAGAADAALSATRDAHLQHRATDGKVMTMGGVASATGVLFAVLLFTAFFGWQSVIVTPSPFEGQPPLGAQYSQPALLFISMFAALGFAIFTSIKPQRARITAPLYAACEGYLLGAISAYFGALYGGIVAQAVLATFGVFLVMLALYGLRVLRATPKFVKGVIAATFGIMFMYLGVFILNLFGVATGFWSGGGIGIVVSLVVVVVAALNLILDFDFIERGTKMGLPRYMDWYGAFGLLVTLVWLYLEMLRLLARLRQ
jgi:uncharacterized YccA/Bax inhibitor family protein